IQFPAAEGNRSQLSDKTSNGGGKRCDLLRNTPECAPAPRPPREADYKETRHGKCRPALRRRCAVHQWDNAAGLARCEVRSPDELLRGWSPGTDADLYHFYGQ